MLKRVGARLALLIVAILLVYIGYWLKPTASVAGAALATAQATILQEPNGVLPPVIAYQARLLDPITGQPKPDGAYTVAFHLYTVATGGSPLWNEIKSIPVSKGLLSTLLGDATPLNLALFTGQELYLGVTVGSDPETAPRQRIAHVAYAIHAEDAATLNGQPASAFAVVNHSHDGAAITSGVIAEARLDPALARDGELLPTILANDGAGSTLDADRLDGQDSTAFAAAGHTHDAAYVNTTGDTMSGVLTVPRVAYSAPRTHNFIVGSEAFVPGSNVAYVNTYGQGGAYISSAISAALVAPVHLPQGAVITNFTIFYYDNSASALSVTLDRQSMTAGFFSGVATIATTGASATYRTASTASISSPVVDNTQFSYLIYAWADPWDGSSNLRIKGALITYTIAEAP
ncbi:MAG: hypothetical protein R3E79_37570 [Caldilineaceae bacterium]